MPSDLALTLAAVFISVAVLTGLIAYAVVARQTPTKRRLGALVKSSGSSHVILEGPLTSGRDPVLARWSMLLPKSAAEMSRLERRLASGGYRSTSALVFYSAASMLLPVAFVVVAFLVNGFQGLSSWVTAGVAGVAGYLFPSLFMDYRVSVRRKQIRNGLPDMLDLLIVCLEAGNSLDQAVVKAGQELAIAYPALAEELRVLTTESRAGIPRIEAFRNFAQRTRVEDVRALVAMLAQTDRFGTSVSQALGTMADDMRIRRRQAAEEKANKLGVKLVFPLVFCLFPALHVVILGPAMLQFTDAFPR